MPEREITKIKQLKEVKDWIYDTKKGEFIRNLFPGLNNGVWKIDGEPMVIYTKDTEIRDQYGNFISFGSPKHFLLCSDKQARELDSLGIVDFSLSQEI